MLVDYRVGDWLVQPRRNHIVSGDVERRLEPRVMELLVYLSERSGELVSRQQILDDVWKDTFVSDESLTTTIRELRRAFGDDATNPAYIQTLPRRGYRLVATVIREQDAHEASSSAIEAPSTNRPRTNLVVAAVGCLIGMVATASFFSLPEDVTTTGPQRFQIDLGENEGLEPGVRAQVALSPDGARMAYVVVRGGTSRLYLRRMDENEATEVPGTEGAFSPFFSPDGEWVGFQAYPADRKLKKVSVHGGTPQTLHHNWLPIGGTWLPDDTIVFADAPDDASNGFGLYRIPASGGDAETLIRSDSQRGEEAFNYPQALPDGDSILFTAVTLESARAIVLSLKTGIHRAVLDNATNARYVPTGHLLFVRGGVLWSVGFDLDHQEVVGVERPLITGIAQRQWSSFGFSTTGLLAYVPGEQGGWIEESLSWAGRDGARTLAASETGDFEWPRVSPLGDKVALYTSANADMASDIWLLDIDSERMQQLTFHDGQDNNPVWTPDGRAVMFASDRGGGSLNIYRQLVASNDDAELILDSDVDVSPLDVSPDGRTLAFLQGQDIYLLSLDDRSVSPLAATDAWEGNAKFSPDGRFLAYVSDEPGQREIFVQPFPPTGRKSQASRGGANDAVWSGDGSELFYLQGRSMMAARVRHAPHFEVLGEHELFEAPRNHNRNFDVHPTTGKFFIVDKTVDSPPRYVNVVTNFFDLLDSSDAPR